MVDRDSIQKALEVCPYQNLYELVNEPNPQIAVIKVSKQSQNNILAESMPHQQESLTSDEKVLACHLIASPFVPYKERGEQLNFSMRRNEKARDGLISREMVKVISLGRSLFLAPTEKLYQFTGTTSPYKRCVSVEHSFSVLFTEYCIAADPMIQKTAVEVPVDNTGRTIDCVSYLKDGNRTAWEVTLNCTNNVASNAAKLKDKGFSKIIFVCRDHNIRKSVQAIIDGAGFDPDFRSTIDTALFGDMFNKRKKLQTRTRK